MPNIIVKDRPTLFPHRDLYDKEQNGPVVDLGVDLEQYSGAICIKFKDVQAIGEAIGMISAQHADMLERRIKELEAQVEALPELAKDFTDGINGNVDSFLSGLTTVGRVPNVPSVPNEPETDGTSGGSIKGKSDSESGSNGDTNPSSAKGKSVTESLGI